MPTFMRPIAAGGPVTITHPEMTRYFMTIPEAVQLVLQAGAMGERGDVFVLDMDEPVRVLDLAMDMIRLSGLEAGADIELQFSGMRPDERQYEEPFFSSADAEPTSHEKILRAMRCELSAGGHASIEQLSDSAWRNETDGELRRLIWRLVPEHVRAEHGRVLASGRSGREQGRPCDWLSEIADVSAR